MVQAGAAIILNSNFSIPKDVINHRIAVTITTKSNVSGCGVYNYKAYEYYGKIEWENFQHKIKASDFKDSLFENPLGVLTYPATLTTTIELRKDEGKLIGSKSISYQIKYEKHFLGDKLLLVK